VCSQPNEPSSRSAHAGQKHQHLRVFVLLVDFARGISGASRSPTITLRAALGAFQKRAFPSHPEGLTPSQAGVMEIPSGRRSSTRVVRDEPFSSGKLVDNDESLGSADDQLKRGGFVARSNHEPIVLGTDLIVFVDRH
jgi:hypothetical protein